MEIRTVYTKERLLAFNRVVAGTKKWFWIVLSVCTAVVLACFGLLWAMHAVDSRILLCLALVLFMDALSPFCAFVLPRLMVSKAKNLNLEILYTFTQEGIQTQAKNDLIEESVTVRYPFITRVLKKGTELYLFFSRQQGYVVDLSSLDRDQLEALKALLQSQIPAKSFRWD